KTLNNSATRFVHHRVSRRYGVHSRGFQNHCKPQFTLFFTYVSFFYETAKKTGFSLIFCTIQKKKSRERDFLLAFFLSYSVNFCVL
ncbi:hypothetical protein, partial [Acinetobacter indicus]|uniref:hypothetical protein n=2 Tax=Acinetobacter TaxID=469 RepID=UPI0025754A0D